MYKNDNRTVVTLDAGGTNFVFSAMKGCNFIVDPITYPSNAQDLDLCLQTMVKGFEEVIARLDEKPVAISFAFPGPADYKNGIIGGFLPNFPSFRDGVPLGPFLEEKFGLPVYINNDGDLFAYGEALCGALPEINERLHKAGCARSYSNLLGYTFGTGFGVGIVVNGQLNRGDNSCVETFCLKHKHDSTLIAEEGVGVRAIKRNYARHSGDTTSDLTPKEISEIAHGERPGDQEAARKAFADLGEIAGDAMAIAAQLIDGIVVLGGGITHSRDLFMPSLLHEMRDEIHNSAGEAVNRVQMKVFDLDNDQEFEQFIKGDIKTLTIPGTDRTVIYDPMKRIGVTISKLGASKAISVGAYAFALSMLDAEDNAD